MGPKTEAECLSLLLSALVWLDAAALDRPEATDATISLAAMHVQQAIELIQSADTLES